MKLKMWIDTGVFQVSLVFQKILLVKVKEESIFDFYVGVMKKFLARLVSTTCLLLLLILLDWIQWLSLLEDPIALRISN